MTSEQYNLLVRFASDFRSALYAYEQEYGVIDLKENRISEIVAAGAELIRIVEDLDPIHSTQEEIPF